MPKLRLVFTALSIAAGIGFVDRAAQALPVEGFTGAFAVGNWSRNPLTSLVDTTGAPKSIAISSPDDGSGLLGISGFEITLPIQSYALSFAWNYTTTDLNPSFDPFGYSLNGIFTPISDAFGANTQAGFTKLVLRPGDLFAFTALSDNLAGSSTTVISAFGAGLPDEVSDCNAECFDFGDAPDSYQTYLASNGPFYQEGYLQRIGLDWDYEPNGQPTLLANGDDINLDGAFGPGTPPLVVDDEDGLTFGPDWVEVLVTIKREGPHDYSLRGWWDLDKSSTFDHDREMKLNRTLLGLTPGLHTVREYLDFDPRDYYSRFRLTWIDDPTGVDGGVSLTTDIQPYGEYTSRTSFPGFGSSHGEVQDVPGPLPILGAGVALGWSRRMKARIRASR